MSGHTRRKVLKAATGIGIGSAAVGGFGGTASAAPTLPNDIWSPYDFGCDTDPSCPGTVESDEFIIRDDDKFTTAGSYGFNWYGSSYNDTFGWTHGIGFGGGCEVEDNDPWDGAGSNLRGQRYSIHVSNPREGEELLKGTSNHLHGVHPSPNDDSKSWAETIVDAGIELALSELNYGIPMGTLIEKLGTDGGFDFNEYDVGYTFSQTGESFPVETWPRCAHSDAVIYVTYDTGTPYLQMKHGYYEHFPSTGLAGWEDTVYTLAGFSTSSSPSTTSDGLTDGISSDRPETGPSSVRPDEMTPEQRDQWGVKSVEGRGLTMEINGQVEEVTHILTKNPFTVVDKRRVSEEPESQR